MDKRALPLDKVDLASGPIFITTMLWEAQVLKKRQQRDVGDLCLLYTSDAADE